MRGRGDGMRTLCWLSCLVGLVACTESRDPGDGAAGMPDQAGRTAADSGGAGRAGGTTAAQGGAGATAEAGKPAAGSLATSDVCEQKEEEVNALVSANLTCTHDSECVV